MQGSRFQKYSYRSDNNRVAQCGLFYPFSHIQWKTEDIILVVQTYTEDEVNVVLERAVEQVL